jgi:hypothetical protein
MHAIGGDASRYPLLDIISSSSTKPDGNREADVAAGGVRQDVMSSLSLAILLKACELYSRAVVFVPCTCVCHFHVNCVIVSYPSSHPIIILAFQTFTVCKSFIYLRWTIWRRTLTKSCWESVHDHRVYSHVINLGSARGINDLCVVVGIPM